VVNRYYNCEILIGGIIMKITTAIKEYLVEIEIRKYSPATLKGARNKLGAFEKYCVEELEIKDIDDITPSTIKLYTQYMMQRGLKGISINGTLKTIKTFVQYCYDEEYGGFNTRKGGFKWVKEDKPVVKTFNRRDVKMMLDNCKGQNYFSIRDAAILTLLFETGVRCLEAIKIKPQDIKDDYILIFGKNNKQRVVPITPLLRKALMKYDRVREEYFRFKPIEENYFLSRSGKALTNSSMLHILKERGKGIKDIRVSPHTCRHFFAQTQIKMGTDIYTISRLLGHENISITQIYLNSLKDEDIIKIAKGNSVLMSM
jgi:integrase/recombinase XerD